jgi:hypothetical protein
MKSRHDLEMQLREKGKWVKGKAMTLGTMLLDHGAEPTRLLEPNFDYGGRMVSIPTEALDYMVALLLYVTPRPRGRTPKESTLNARILTDAGMSQRKAARLTANITGESADNLRKRLGTPSKVRPRKTPSHKTPSSPKPRSPGPRSNKPR